MNICKINYIYSTNYYDLQLEFYLAGLIEGDGNILIYKILKSAKAPIYNPQITFTFHLKEKPLFAKLKTVLDIASLY
jgi:hypothetical protein